MRAMVLAFVFSGFRRDVLERFEIRRAREQQCHCVCILDYDASFPRAEVTAICHNPELSFKFDYRVGYAAGQLYGVVRR
jgi:hypothetical protein